MSRNKKKKQDHHIPRKIFLIIIFTIAQLIFFISPAFKISSIVVLGCDKNVGNEVRSKVSSYYDKHLLIVNTRGIKENLITIHKIKNIDVTKKLPSSIYINITQRNPILQIKTAGLNQLVFLCDDEGVILEQTEKPNDLLPIITLQDKILIGKKIPSERIKAGLSVFNTKNNNINNLIKEVTIDENNNLTLEVQYKKDTFIVKIGKTEDINEKYKILENILQTFDTQGKGYEYIDLRFKEPAIKLESNGAPKDGIQMENIN